MSNMVYLKKNKILYLNKIQKDFLEKYSILKILF